PAQLAFRTHFAGDAGDFGGEGVELVDHRVDRVLQLQDLAAHVHGDLLGEVAVGDRRSYIGDVADLGDEVARHRVHAVAEVHPLALHAAVPVLPAQLAFRTDFAGDAGDFGGEGVELVDHRVDRVLQLQDLAAHVHGDLLGEVAVRDRRSYIGD